AVGGNRCAAGGAACRWAIPAQEAVGGIFRSVRDVGEIGNVGGRDPGPRRRLEQEHLPVEPFHVAASPVDQARTEVHERPGHVVGEVRDVHDDRGAAAEAVPHVEGVVVVLGPQLLDHGWVFRVVVVTWDTVPGARAPGIRRTPRMRYVLRHRPWVRSSQAYTSRAAPCRPARWYLTRQWWRW